MTINFTHTEPEVEGMRPCMKRPIVVQCKQINEEFMVQTLEGPLRGKPYDYLMQGIDGELYPCDQSIFDRTYTLL